MRDLKVSGVDGADLHLVDDDGGRYRLSVDDRVRESVREAVTSVPTAQDEPSPGDPPRTEHADAGAGGDAPTIAIAPEPVTAPTPVADIPHLPPGELVTPRAVQELLRAGHSADQVATASGWDVAKVERYAAPIEAERSYIAGLAQDLPVGATTTDTATTVGDRVAARLHDRGVAGDTVAWDAHRTAGRGWVVVCRFSAGGRTREASWLFRAATRTLTAVDDEARWLGEDERAAGGPIPAPAAPVKVFDVEAEGGVTEPAGSSGSAGSASSAGSTGSSGSSGPVDLVSAMQARSRGRRTRGARGRAGRTPVDLPPMDGASVSVTDHLDTQPVPVQQPGQTGHEADRAVPDDAPPTPTVDDLGHDPVTGTVDLFGAVALHPDDAASASTSDDGADPDLDAGMGSTDVQDAEAAPAVDDENVVDPENIDDESGDPDGAAGSDDSPASDDIEDPADLHDARTGAYPAPDRADAGTQDDAAPAVTAADPVDEESPEPLSNAQDDASVADQAEEAHAGVPEEAVPSPAPPRRPSNARSGRPSVPSWDDIMFGGRRGRD